MILGLTVCSFELPHQLLLLRGAGYAYKPLHGRQIRILRLLPGRHWMRLEAEIETIEVEDGQSHDFEALSYCWGSDNEADVVYIKGAPKPITTSLSSLLRRLRQPTKSRRLWVDGVCINQDDVEEKSHQIGLMATIYSVAARVLVDLGEETWDSSLAMELLDRFWRRHIWSGLVSDHKRTLLSLEDTATYLDIELPQNRDELVIDNTPEFSWLQKQTVMNRLWVFYCRASLLAEFYGGFGLPGVRHGLGRRELPPPQDARWSSVGNLFARPWFSRIWVIQEFVFAKEAVIVCGKRQYKWQHVLAGIYPFGSGMPPVLSNPDASTGCLAFYCICVLRQHRFLRKTAQGREFLIRMRDTGHLWQKFQQLRLIDLLHYFRISSATVNKDRYFALLNIADDVVKDGRLQLELTYSMPTNKILLRVGRFLIQNAYGEEMLGRAGLWQQRDAGDPSWIENFGSAESIPQIMDQTVVYTGDEAGGPGGFHASALPVNEDSAAAGFIMLQGWKLDVIDTEPFNSPFAGTASGDRDPFDVLLDYVPMAIRALVGDGSEVWYFNGERVTAALCATLISGLSLSLRNYNVLEKGFHVLAWVSAARKNPRAVSWALRRAVTRFGASWDETWQIYLDYKCNVFYSAVSQGKQPARTRKGYFASLPSCFERGDEIWVVKGCRTPLLLRKSLQFPGCYRLVRSCYVHGFMNGEALEKDGFQFGQLSLH